MYEYKKVYDYRDKKTAERMEAARFADAKEFYDKYKDSFVTVPCPVCGDERYDNVEKFLGIYEVARCKKCSTLYVTPRPTEDLLAIFYNTSQTMTQLSDFYKKTEGQTERKKVIDDRVELCLKYIKSSNKTRLKILDVGCSVGSFLKSLELGLENAGLGEKAELHGLDVDKNVIEIAKREGGNIQYHLTSVEDFSRNSPEKFDLIISWYVIEHLFDPRAFLRSAASLLSDNGVLIFTTNNCAGLDHEALGYNAPKRIFAHGIWPPFHLNGFSADSMKLFAFRAGMDFVEMGSFGQFDLDLLSACASSLREGVFLQLNDVDEKSKGIFQAVIRRLNMSGDMFCVFQKPNV